MYNENYSEMITSHKMNSRLQKLAEIEHHNLKFLKRLQDTEPKVPIAE